MTKECVRQFIPSAVLQYEEVLMRKGEQARNRVIAMGVPLVPNAPVGTPASHHTD